MYYSGKYYAYIQVRKNNVSELSFQSKAGADYSNENTLSETWLMKLQKSDRIQLKANSSRDPGPSFKCYSNTNCLFNGKYIRSI